MRAHFNFTGASGTGKTTALDLLKKQLPSTYRIHTNVIRDLASQKGLTLNELATEQTQNLIFEAYENILHNDKDVVAKVFNELAPKYADRNGGYTRIIKLKERVGDDALTVKLELVAQLQN